MTTYALVEFIPDSIHRVIVCPICSLESCAICPIPGISNVHLECERSTKDETEEDEVSSEEGTIDRLQLAPRFERGIHFGVADSRGEGVERVTCL